MRIGVLTSGGDAPGMNGVIRTMVVAGRARGHTIIGVRRGYQGLIEGDAAALEVGDVYGISRGGGTILGSSRSAAFPTPEGQARAHHWIRKLGLEALVIAGGNGSLAGARLLGRDRPCLIIGVPASIDNDIGHCGLSIGVDTAVNTIVEACDRISDTARAHRRAFVIEVMGRHCGFLAMRAGIAAEADAILYGEVPHTEDELVEKLRAALRACFAPGRDKNRALIVKSESVAVSTETLVGRLQHHLDEDAPGVEIRATVLGHVVRGGSPSGMDRTISQRLAYAALMAAEAGRTDVMVSWDVPGGVGEGTLDPYVRIVAIEDVLAETARLLDGSSPVVAARLRLLRQVEDLFLF